MTGRVCLVGAGCGSADLITLRGMERLSRCGAVVYDDLIDPALLDLAPADAQRVYMGKRSGRHSAPQTEISAALIDLARQGKTVVRLKGGDPFVFGRGGEEIQALQQAGVPFEVVPGISSAIAIPAGAGIPVTHRGLSRSFHVITGHTADTEDGLPGDLSHLAQTTGTLVFLMGLGRLPQIARRLIEAGRPADTPAAVISGGNSPNPATVRGTLADIADKAALVRPPAVIVVGEVAALDFSPTVPAPLRGIRVGITGSPRMADSLTVLLRDLGASVRCVSRSILRELPADPRLSALADGQPKWAVLTSPNGVEVLFRQLRERNIDLRTLSACRFAVIGAATRDALARRGIYADLCPAQHTSAALADALTAAARPKEPIFLLRSAKGAAVLREKPAQAGFSVWDLPLYDTVPDPVTARLTPADLEGLDFLTFASADGVESFFRQYGVLPAGITPVCIGPVTAAALEKHTGRPPLTASDTSAAGIVAAIRKDANR